MNSRASSARPGAGSSFSLSEADRYSALDSFDEMLDAQGRIRPHWQALYNSPRGLNPALVASRQARMERALLENALTYAVTDPATGRAARPLSADQIPLVISQADWAQLEAGARQRATLLNMMLADLYGPHALLKDGLLPPALALGNPGFLRPMHGVAAAGGLYVHSFAMDVTRGPDGNWWVLRDHSQATAASGFALENRIISGQLYPEMARELHVKRLAPHFQKFQEQLVALSNKDEPRILCYSPGPSDRRYLAQAYLARYLGYTMAEGPDLTMRDGKVYFKTLDGLKPVDVILRQVDAHMCDPLELDTSSVIGIPGLVTAIRTGGVAVANSLGSGLVETGALAGYMPELARSLLDEDLKLPNLATWWCGEPAAADYVLDNFDQLSIGPAHDGDPMIARRLLEADEDTRRELLKHYGGRVIGQERMSLPTMPTLHNGALVPAPFVLRVFVTSAPDGFSVMPGGLVLTGHPGRAASTEDFAPITMKDAWVISDKEEPAITLLAPGDGGVAIRRTGKDLASRAADNLFWLGRYAERTEFTCRMLRTVISALTEDGQIPADPAALAAATTPLMNRAGLNAPVKTASDTGDERTGPPPAFPEKLRLLLSDPIIAYGLPNCMGGVIGTAGRIRDRLSLATFRTVQSLQDSIHELGALKDPRVDLNNALKPLDDLLLMLNALSGQAQEYMTRNTGWRFLDMGRRLERAMYMVELVSQLLGTSGKVRDGRLVLLLDLADSFMTYRARYMTNPMPAPTLDLLLVDETNPRSVGYQVMEMDKHLEHLAGMNAVPPLSAERQVTYSILSELRLARVNDLVVTDDKGRRDDLIEMMDRFEGMLLEYGPLIARSYFSHADIVTTSTANAPISEMAL